MEAEISFLSIFIDMEVHEQDSGIERGPGSKKFENLCFNVNSNRNTRTLTDDQG